MQCRRREVITQRGCKRELQLKIACFAVCDHKPTMATFVQLQVGDEVNTIVGSTKDEFKERTGQTGTKHWKDVMAKNKPEVVWPEICCAIGCDKKAVNGGHVKIHCESSGTWYIVPVCRDPHNLAASNVSFVPRAGTWAVEDPADFCEHIETWGSEGTTKISTLE
jgi:hypothetical protein